MAKLSEAECVTVLAHEALHCALLHPLRRGDRDPLAWNIACDHAVNLHLEACNAEATAKGRAIPFPWPSKLQGILKDPQYAGKCAEDIYTAPAPSDKPVNKEGSGMGEVRDAPGDEAQRQEIEASLKVGLTQAAALAKGQGKLPGSLARMVDEVLNPPRRWQDILREFVTVQAKHPNAILEPIKSHRGSL